MPHDSSQHNWEAGWQEKDPFQQADHFQAYDNGDESSSGFHEDHTGDKGYWNEDGEFDESHPVAGVDADALVHAQAMAVFATQNHSSGLDLETTAEALPELEEQQVFPILAALTEQTGDLGSEAETTTQSELPPPQGTNHGTTQDTGEEEVPQKPRKAFNLEISNQEPKIPPDADGEVYADRSDANHDDGKALPDHEPTSPAPLENALESDASAGLPEHPHPNEQVTNTTSNIAEHQPNQKKTDLPTEEKHAELEKPVDAMNAGDKLKAVLQKTLEKLPDKAREILQQLVAPENIVTTGGVIAATAIAQGTPLAPFVDAALTAYAIEQLGEQAKEAIDELNAFLQTWNNMQSEQDLEAAAEHLANLVEMGAGILLDKLMDGRGHGHGEGEGGTRKQRESETENHRNTEPPNLGEDTSTNPESLPPGEGNPLEVKPTAESLSPEGSNPSSSQPAAEHQALERQQKWREEGEVAWQALEQQIRDGQKYTGEFKSKEEFLKRYEDGQTFNPETRSWGKQAELRADNREPITHSTESKPEEVLESLISTTEQGNDKSFAPYLKMLKSLGLEDQGNKHVLAKLEELGFGKNTEGGQSKKPKDLKEDDVRSALKKHFEEKVLNLMTDPDAHSRKKLADHIRESEPNLSKREAMEKASEQVRKQSETEVEALLKKDPKLSREQAEVMRQQQASHRAALEITENLSSSDKGNLMEDWYDKTYKSEKAIRHLELGEVDHSRTPAPSGKKRGKIGDIELEGIRAIDRLEVKEVNGQQVAQLKEIKNISGVLSGENLAQFDDFAKIAAHKPIVGIPDNPGGVTKGKRVRINGLTYTITNPLGIAKNAAFILKKIRGNENLSFEIFNTQGERMIIDLNNFDEWTVNDLIKWTGITDK